MPRRGDPRFLNRICSQTEFFLQAKRYPQAIDSALKALAIDPKDPRPYVQIASAKARLRDPDAPNWARKAIEIEPEKARWHAALADTYTLLGKYSEAFASMQEALNISAESPALQSAMGACLINLRRNREAIEYLQNALSANPEDPTSHARMSMALFNTGDRKLAQQHLSKALQLSPDNPRLHNLLGWQFIKRGKRKEANEAFYEALRLDPTQAYAKLGIGRLGSRFNPADIYLRTAFSNRGGKRLLILRIVLAVLLLFETSIFVHSIYLWAIWGVELVVLFAYYRIGHKLLRIIARRRGINAV